MYIYIYIHIYVYNISFVYMIFYTHIQHYTCLHNEVAQELGRAPAREPEERQKGIL